MHLSVAALVEPSRNGVAQQPNAPRVSEEVLSCIRGLSSHTILQILSQSLLHVTTYSASKHCSIAMLWRQSLLRGPCLDRPSLTPLATALRIYGPPLRALRPAVVGRRRWLASVSSTNISSIFAQQQQANDIDHLDQSKRRLEELLRVIRCKETGHVVPAFHAWVMLLVSDDPQTAWNAHQQMQTLPVNVLSAVIRALDPIENPKLDIAHGLRISLGEIQFTSACALVDEFGMRRHHVFVLDAMRLLLEARRKAKRELVIADYETFMRCAGAAGDIQAAMFFFGAIREHGLAAKRTTTTWNEFLKARYQMHPTYYQYDRQRVLLEPRHGYRTSFRTPLANVWRVETLRHAMNALQKLPFNRQRNRPSASNYLWMRQKMGFQSYFAHWRRTRGYGVLLNEELLCNTLIGLSRSGSLSLIRSMVLKKGLGIGLLQDKETGIFDIAGYRRRRPGSPKAPTVRFLNAIVEAFGCMSRIRLCLDLVIHVSKVYNIPIPPETWNNLFNWAYVCSTKSNQAQRKYLESFPICAVVDADLVTRVWDTMTSEPYNIEPTFESYIARIKTLIVQSKFSAARDMLREHAVKHYRRLEKEHKQIVVDEVLRGVTEISHRRLTIETQKEHAWYMIEQCLYKFLSRVSGTSRREASYPNTVIPNFVLEFGEFMTEGIGYRTVHGYVHLEREVEPRRYEWKKRMRTTLPQVKGGLEVQAMAARGQYTEVRSSEGVILNWPTDRPMRVLGWEREPIPRTRAKGAPPESTDVNANQWWMTLADELMR